MLTQFTPCDPQRLERLLDGTLPDAAQSEVERHVEACESCRQRLESLAADDEWWQETREAFAGLDRDAPTYCDDLLNTLAWVRELVTMIHLAKYTGAPASRAEELVLQIATAVEGLSEVAAWRDETHAAAS